MQWSWKIDDQNLVELKLGLTGRERVTLNGVEIYNKLVWRMRNNIQFRLSDGRAAEILVKASGGIVPQCSLYVEHTLVASSRDNFVAGLCAKCGHQGLAASKFCEKCGDKLPDAEEHRRHTQVKEATQAIAVMAGMFLVFGIIMFFVTRNAAEKTLEQLHGRADTEIVQMTSTGKEISVGELKGVINTQPMSILVMNVVLAFIMLGLTFWSKTSPLPAILIATGIYAVVIVGNAIVDPATIAQGIVLKVIIIGFLFRGIKSALEVRAYRPNT